MTTRPHRPAAIAVLATPTFAVWGGLALAGIAAMTVAYVILVSSI